MYDLHGFFLLEGLPEKAYKELTEEMTVRSFGKGDVIYGTSAFEKALGVMLEGRAAALEGGTEKRQFSEGDVFGAAAVFGAGETYISEIAAISDCTVAFICEDGLRKIIRTYPECAENYISFLSDRIRYLNVKISHFTGGGAKERVFRYLTDNADDGTLEVTMSETAKLTGLSRSQLYEAMDRLEEEGKISRNGRKITIGKGESL